MLTLFWDRKRFNNDTDWFKNLRSSNQFYEKVYLGRNLLVFFFNEVGNSDWIIMACGGSLNSHKFKYSKCFIHCVRALY